LTLREPQGRTETEDFGPGLAERVGELRSIIPPKGAFRGFASSVRGVWARRDLLGLLVSREIKSRYKNSALGAVWSLIRPLALLLIYWVAVGKFLGAERSVPEFAVFLFSGLTVWTLYNEVITGTTGSIVANAGLIKKVYLPREIFPLAAVGSAGFNFIVMLAVLLVFTLVTGHPPRLEALWTVPVAIVLVLLWGFAFGLLLSALDVFLRDVGYLVEIALMVLFWGSPIVYSFQFVHDYLQGGWLEQVYLANPVTTAVLLFQQGMWSAGPEQWLPPFTEWRIVIFLAVSLVVLWIAQRIFARLEGSFAQEI